MENFKNFLIIGAKVALVVMFLMIVAFITVAFIKIDSFNVGHDPYFWGIRYCGTILAYAPLALLFFKHFRVEKLLNAIYSICISSLFTLIMVWGIGLLVSI